MAPKTGSDLEEIRALLAEVKALREDVELKGAELRSSWGVDADKSKVPPRVLNLSHYIALRAHDLTDLQYPARGAGALFAWPQRKPCRAGARCAHCDPQAPERRIERALSVADVGEGGRGGAGGGGRPAVRQAAKKRPARAGHGDLAARGGDGTRIGRQSGRRWHGLRAHQLRPRRPRNVGANDRECAPGGGAARASLPGADGHRRPQVPHPQSEGAAENAPLARRPDRSGRRTAREDQGADRVLAQFSRTRRPTRRRLRNLHRRRQGGGARGLQIAGPGRDRGLRRAREGGAAEARQGRQFSLDRTRSAAADLQGLPRPRLHRRACRPDRLFVRAAGRRHRAPAGSSGGARAQARAAGARVEDRDAARGAQSAAAHPAVGRRTIRPR